MSANDSTNLLMADTTNAIGTRHDMMITNSSSHITLSNYPTIRIIIAILLHVLMKFWKLCTTALLFLLLLYWFYGNLITFVLFIVAILGK